MVLSLLTLIVIRTCKVTKEVKLYYYVKVGQQKLSYFFVIKVATASASHTDKQGAVGCDAEHKATLYLCFRGGF